MVSYLDTANKLMQAPLGIFGQSLAIAVFPALTQFYALKQMDRYRNQLASTMRTVIYLTIPVTVLMFVMAPQIIGAIYEQGRFTADDTAVTAECLRYFAVGITAWCLHPVLMRGFFAIQNTVTPIILGTLTTGVFIALIYALRGMMEYRALPTAGSLSAIALVIVLSMFVAPRIGGLDLRSLLVTLVKSLLSSLWIAALAASVAYTPLAVQISGNKVATIGAVLGVFLVGAWLYYFTTKVLGMKEADYIKNAMDRRRA